ncbi:MAG TPA: HEAT repeat domain-containing protein [Nannocystaceae bacterium]|nr:HEAT repeat domain-containing protein [Nannocystaceae bacterium]
MRTRSILAAVPLVLLLARDALAGPAVSEEPYDRAWADDDVVVILTDTSKAYLQARARLVANPGPGTQALIAKLEAVPPPTAAERKRLLDVLAEIGGPDNVELFAGELRRACVAAKKESQAVAAAEVWRPLLRDLGAHAQPALVKLVADKDLPVPVRALLLDDLVEVTPAATLPQLLVLAGRGHPTLRQQLVRALRRRVRADAAERDALVAAIDAELEAAEPSRLAALVQLRTGLGDAIDDAFANKLAAMASDAQRQFPVRVAALRALGAAGDHPAAQGALDAVAVASLPATTQAQEILATLSLQALPKARVEALARQHQLDRSPSPRLAAIGWSAVRLPAPEKWIDRALADPWPSVRVAALGRVASPCSRRSVGELTKVVGDAKAGADADAGVQRAAIDALGRCGDEAAFAALKGMLDDGDVALELSGAAARELAKNYGTKGGDAVAKVLASRPEQAYGRRLAQALRHTTQPSPYVKATLCAWASEGGGVGKAAVDSLVELYGDPNDACAEAG